MATFDYTSRDYYSIREDLLSRAAALPIGTDWNTRSPADFGVMLVDLWAYMGDVLHFYVDRAAAEAYLRTATQRESVLALANLLDYESLPLNSAQATVNLESTITLPSPVTIPEGTSFVAPSRNSSEDTVYYVSTSDVVMSSSNPAVVNVTEGTFVIDEQPVNSIASNGNMSNGSPSQRFVLRYPGVIPSSVVTYVYEGPVVSAQATAVEYNYVTRLSDYSSSDRVFTVTTSSDGVIQIVFGNGLNGKIPSTNASITVNYLRSSGAAGNIVANRISAFTNTAPTNIIITGSSSAVAGYDEESIDSLKTNVPLLFRTQDRAVSLQDFKDLALRVPGVLKATAVSSNGNVVLYPISFQEDYLSITFGSTINIDSFIAEDTLTYFEARTVVGASVTIASSISLTPVHVQAQVYVKEGYVQRWVLNSIEEVFDEFFTFDAVSLGQTLALGELYRAAMDVEGIDYINITVFNTTSTGISSGNKITAEPTSMLHKAADYVLVPTGGVTG